MLTIDEARHGAVLETICTHQENTLLVSGEAKVLLP